MANDTNPIKYSDLIAPDNSIESLIKQLKEADDAYNKLADDIKKQAVDVKAKLQGVSGATAEQRKRIGEGATEAEKLAKAYKEVEFAMGNTAKEIQRLKEIQKEEAQINKLLIKRGQEEITMNNVRTKTYEQVSAQFALNKIRLNSMTEAQRESTEEGKKLVQETIELKNKLSELNSLNMGKGKATPTASAPATLEVTTTVGRGEEYTVQEEAVKRLNLTLDQMAKRMEAIRNSGYEQYITTNTNGTKQYNNAITEVGRSMAQLESIETELNLRLKEGAIDTDEYDKQMLALRSAIDSVTKSSEQLNAERSKTSSGEDDKQLIATFDQTDETIKRLVRSIVELQLENDQTKAKIKELNAEYKAGNITEQEYLEKKTMLTNAMNMEKDILKNLNSELKTQTQIVNSAETSYDRLSAQYNQNKDILNSMTKSEREATAEGQKLEKESALIYEEMKRLQEVTGKHQLSVGDYEKGTQKLTMTIRTNTYALAQMRMAGQDNTEEYRNLLAETGRLKDAFRDASKEVQGMASDTGKLDSVMSGLSAVGGGFTAVTGAMTMFGSTSEDVAQAQKTLQSAMSITMGLTALQTQLQRQSGLMMAVSTLQTYALAKSELYRNKAQAAGTKSTVLATIAQKAFNLVAMANPYVLLAVALVTVVGALILFANNAQKAAKEQEKLNKVQEQHLDVLNENAAAIKRDSKERQDSLQRQIQVATAQKKSLTEIRKLEDQYFEERRKEAKRLLDLYADEVGGLERNRKKAEELRKELERIDKNKDRKAKINFEVDGKQLRMKVEDAMKYVQGILDVTNKNIEIGMDVVSNARQVNTDEALMKAERVSQAQAIAKAELDIVRKAEDERLKLIADAQDKEKKQAENATKRQIQDLRLQLKQDENLTVKARKAINDQILALQEQLQISLVDIDNRFAKQRRDMLRETEDLEMAAMSEGITKQRKQLNEGYNRQIEDIRVRLETERGLTEEARKLLNENIINLEIQQRNALRDLNDNYEAQRLQSTYDSLQMRLEVAKAGSQEEIDLTLQMLEQKRRIEIAQNKLVTEDLRKSEEEINAKYNAMILQESDKLTKERELMLFDRQQALMESEFDLIRATEEEKTRYRLQMEADRWKKILELNETASEKLSDAEVKTIQNTIEKIGKEIDKSKKKEKGKDIYSLFGLKLDEDEKKAISTSVQYAMDAITSFLDAKVQAADAAVTASEKEVSAAQSRLDAEIEARNNGYASNVAGAQRDLELARKTQEKALKDQEKAQKAQAALQTIQQTGDLITATAQIWAALGGFPPAAIAAIGVMWGSFAAAKIKAAQVTKANAETYGEGTIEMLQGGSHQSGNDIDLGTKPDGTRRRAEGGEYFAVFRKRSSRKYRSLIPDVVKSLNDGTFENKYRNAYNTGSIEVNLNGDNPDLRGLSDDVREIKEQNRRKYISVNGKMIEVYKNLKRTYLN